MGLYALNKHITWLDEWRAAARVFTEGQVDVFCQVTLISHNVLIRWFYKVNSPTKPSTYCFNY